MQIAHWAVRVNTNPTVKGSGAGSLKAYRAPAITKAQDSRENLCVLGLRDKLANRNAQCPNDINYMRGYRSA